MKILTVLAFLGGLLLASAASAQERRACDRTDVMFTRLANIYQEMQVGLGPTLTGRLMTLLTSKHGETWSLVLSMPDGSSCMIAAGEGWRNSLWVDPAENRI